MPSLKSGPRSTGVSSLLDGVRFRPHRVTLGGALGGLLAYAGCLRRAMAAERRGVDAIERTLRVLR